MKKLGILLGCLFAGIVIGVGVTAWLTRPARVDEDPQVPGQDVREQTPGPSRQDSTSSESGASERTPFVNGTRIASA